MNGLAITERYCHRAEEVLGLFAASCQILYGTWFRGAVAYEKQHSFNRQ